MFDFSVRKDMIKKDITREEAVGKIVAHLCLTLIVKELKTSVGHGRMVTTLNIIKHLISFLVYWCRVTPCLILKVTVHSSTEETDKIFWIAFK